MAYRDQPWVLQNHILRDNEVSGMVLDFDKALNDLSDVIPYFDLIIKMDDVPPKTQNVLVNVLFNKSFQNMDVKFDMTTRHKEVFDCLQVSHV